MRFVTFDVLSAAEITWYYTILVDFPFLFCNAWTIKMMHAIFGLHVTEVSDMLQKNSLPSLCDCVCAFKLLLR